MGVALTPALVTEYTKNAFVVKEPVQRPEGACNLGGKAGLQDIEHISQKNAKARDADRQPFDPLRDMVRALDRVMVRIDVDRAAPEIRAVLADE